ncbi:hypothetical protein QJS04_geneDACA014092 [Acorus gramineus]|uniref:Uncharacterized protein n=1 Tax=Acorus gramineus TaxID=55184 RepID=A0AAV9B5I0_ACOGR|nr:hypothetical protein QJS04_geneDACA014092 [Acorus gramineus]
MFSLSEITTHGQLLYYFISTAIEVESEALLIHIIRYCIYYCLPESTVTIEGLGHKSRSITLEEATYAILFCSSIVHDLAYKAASIAMERESSASLEAICLTVTTINKPVPNRKDNTRSNRSSNKRKKTYRKRLDTETKTLPAEDKNDFKIQDPWMSKTEALNGIDTAKPPKLELKCNCTVM